MVFYTLSPEHHNYSNYKFTVDYDLSAYDGKLEDGDTFTFTVPSPLTVRNETFELKDRGNRSRYRRNSNCIKRG